MPIASLISQDTKSVKDLFANAEALAKIESIVEDYQLFIIVRHAGKKDEDTKEIISRNNIYDIAKYDVSTSIIASSDILIFLTGTEPVVFRKTKNNT